MTALTLSKAGAGSRGGHIIGQTRSGHPIYESHHARYASMHVHAPGSIGDDANRIKGSFGHYSPKDHEQAASAHFKQAYEADHAKGVPTTKGKEHLRAALAHNRLANTVSKKSLTQTAEIGMEFGKSGAGSRGGKVIGTTRSGKPIYADRKATSRSYGSFTHEDHNDAAKAHLAHLNPYRKDVSATRMKGHLQMGEQHIAARNKLKAGLNPTSSVTGKSMTSTDLFKDFLSKGNVTSGNIDFAETVDGLDADMTGESSKGKSTSAPVSDDDRDEEDKKVKKKVGKNAQNGGPAKSVAETVDYDSSMSGKEDKLQDCGPYDFGGDVTDDIGNAPSGQLVDGYILRAEQIGEMLKGDEANSASKTAARTAVAYQGADAKTYQQRIEQRGFVQHATGGMDDYLAAMSKSNGFYANGSDHHNPNDANHVAQTLCKSCDQSHSSLYGVCPHCGPSVPFGKSHDQSQNHTGFGMQGREKGSALVDMSAFSLED